MLSLALTNCGIGTILQCGRLSCHIPAGPSECQHWEINLQELHEMRPKRHNVGATTICFGFGWGVQEKPRHIFILKLSNSEKEGQQATGSPQCLSAHQQCQNARSEISPDMLHNVLPDTPQCVCQYITNNGKYVNTYLQFSHYTALSL